MTTISRLFIHPIKSCAAIECQHVELGPRGPLLDRDWMLVDAQSGKFITQRKFPQMALIKPRMEGEDVVVSAPGCEDLKLPKDGQKIPVTVWSDGVQGLDCGDEAAQWFSAYLNTDCRLVYQGDCERLADVDYAPKHTAVSFADGFPMLVINQGSIDYLNEKCPQQHIAAERFRANIVVSGAAAFSEEKWQGLTTESVEMTVVKPCQRCVIPSIDPQTAEKNKAVMQVLLDECRRNGKVYFGQNLVFNCKGENILRVGDEIELKSV